MNLKQIKIIVIVLVFLSFLFLGKAITGFYTMDWQQKPCLNDKTCESGEVCCYFYQENAGICDRSSNCEAISLVTKEEKETRTLDTPLTPTQFESLAAHFEKPELLKANIAFVIVGFLILLLATYLFRKEIKPSHYHRIKYLRKKLEEHKSRKKRI